MRWWQGRLVETRRKLCLQCLWAHTRDFSLTVVVKFYFSLATRGFRWPFSRFFLVVFFLSSETRWLWGKSSFRPKLLLAPPLVDVQFLKCNVLKNTKCTRVKNVKRWPHILIRWMSVRSRVLEAGACNRPNCFAFYSPLLKLTMKMTCLSLLSMMMCFILFGSPRKLSPYWKG